MPKNNKYIVWRWARPATKFEPTKNRPWRDVILKSHSKVVFAALRPTDWMWLFARPRSILHRIELSKEQADQCVVAEQHFRPSEDKINEYMKKTGRNIVGVLIAYSKEKYEDSFIPLPKYSGGYFLPEVLIPFEVKGKPCRILTWWLRTKKAYLSRKIGEYPTARTWTT